MYSFRPSAVSSQQILEGLVKDMDMKVAKALRTWDTRHTRLEQCKQVLLFEEEVPKVTYDTHIHTRLCMCA